MTASSFKKEHSATFLPVLEVPSQLFSNFIAPTKSLFFFFRVLLPSISKLERRLLTETLNDSTVMDVRSVVEAVSTDDDDAPLYQVESLCMRCGENGITRFLLTLIPHFRKILLSAFECPHCGERNNEVQFAGEIQPRGSCYRLEFSSGD
ncbi:hypothetical protein Lser_V15G22236 [Lactuca serriola]